MRKIWMLSFLVLAGALPGWPAKACVTNPVVTNNADSGPGSLRDAIGTACAGSTITFASTVASPILLASQLEIEQSLTIQGPGANLLTLSGNHRTRVLRIGLAKPDIDVTLSDLTIADGNPGFGGSPSSQFLGGGIINYATGVVTIANSTLSGNSASGGIQGLGGAIFNWGGKMNIVNSTFSGNSASSKSTGISGGGSAGGAIINYQNGRMSITNSTLSGNTVNGVDGSGSAGAIYTYPSAVLNLTNCTISGNSVNSSNNGRGSVGGGITNEAPGTVNVSNTIIAGNLVTSSNNPTRGPDIAGAFISQGYNLIGSNEFSTGFSNGVNHDQVGSNPPLDPRLDPSGLQYNGGSTKTLALLPGSPAIDHGSLANDPSTGKPIATDQRGFVRPVDDPATPDVAGGNGSDIGAFEYLSHLAGCVPPPNTTMVAWYPFDESTGTLSTNLATGNSGTQVGGPTPVPGKVAGALRFDGVDSYVESPSSIVTNFGPAGSTISCSGSYSSCPGNFSIDTWLRVDPGGPSFMVLVDKRLAGKGYHFFLFAGSLGLQLADGQGQGTGYTNYFSPVLTPDLTDGNWHHVAVTVRRNSHSGIRWYHNGVPVGISDPTDRPGSLANNSPLRIGARAVDPPLSGWFAGDLDELEIFNRALTPQEVASIFTAGASGKCK